MAATNEPIVRTSSWRESNCIAGWGLFGCIWAGACRAAANCLLRCTHEQAVCVGLTVSALDYTRRMPCWHEYLRCASLYNLTACDPGALARCLLRPPYTI
jgi:hypothetical protein